MGRIETKEDQRHTAVGVAHTAPESACKPEDTLLSKMDLPFRAMFFPLGYAVEIMTNDPEVLTAADESFGHLGSLRDNTPLRVCVGICQSSATVCPAEPMRWAFRHLYSLVADSENQAVLDLKTCTAFAWLSRAAVRHRLYLRHNFLEKIVYLLVGATFVTDLHTACVSKKGRGILLWGESGAGKSTLAYACARSGWTYTSDDTSYLINDADFPRVIGHAHRVRFRPSAKELFPELLPFAVAPRMEGKPSIEVLVSELPVAQTASECDVYAIVYLRRYAAAPGALIRQPGGTATQRARSELYSAGEIRARHEKILEKLWEVPTYELHYSDINTGVQLLDHLSATF